jgi:nucleoside-diphosphate-sugar epimerase
MRSYLVTGGLGFLGAPLARALVRAGHRVRVLDNASRGSAERLGEARSEVEILTGDIRDAGLVHQALQGMDSVCHLAFVNGTQYFYERPAYVLEVGVKGMVNILDGCLKAGVRELILASSSEVYQTPPRVPTDESVPLSVPDPHNPRYSYAGGKIISELMAIHYGRERFERVLIFRPHNVFGPDMGWEHVIPQLTCRIMRLKSTARGEEIPLPIQGTGEQSRAFIYIDDFIAALMTVITRGEHLSIYNIGTAEELAIREVAHRIAAFLEVRIRIVPAPEAAGGTARRCPDIGKLERLGFRPRLSFDDGLRRTVAWYATHTPPKDLSVASSPTR